MALSIGALPAAGVIAQSSGDLSAATPAGLVRELQDLGFRAKLTSDSNGDPKIETAASGAQYAIYFYGCENGEMCRDLLFASSFRFDDGYEGPDMASWNLERLMGRAYLDQDGDPTIEHYVVGAGQIAQQDFARLLEQWEKVVAQFMDHIDW